MEPRPQACGTFWYSSCPPPARYKKVKESRPKQSQKTWQDSALWNPNPPAWKKKKPEYNPLHPGYFCNVSSLFFPGRLDVSESHVLQTTAWQKAVVAFAFCVCQFSAPLTRVTLLVRGSQQTVNSKTKPKKHLKKKNPTKFKCEIFWKENPHLQNQTTYFEKFSLYRFTHISLLLQVLTEPFRENATVFWKT